MIRQIKVKGFQSLADIDIRCGPLTVISGQSDVGKSALVRALRSMATNRYPRDHVTDGQKSSVVGVILDTDSGTVAVAAKKGGGENRYVVAAGGDSRVYNKVGARVPDEVERLLGRSPYTFGGQFDPLFLVAEVGSRRAKVLGGLSNMAILLEAVRLAGTEIRTLKATERIMREQAEAAERLIENLEADVSDARKREEALGENLEDLEDLWRKLSELEDIDQRLGVSQREIQAATADVERLKGEMPELETLADELTALADLEDLEESITKHGRGYTKAKEMVSAAKANLNNALEDLEDFKAKNPICPMCGKEGWHG